MDPVSVVGLVSGIATLTKILDSGLVGIADFISQSNKVDQTIQGYSHDVGALSHAIGSIATRLGDDNGSRLSLDSPASKEAAQSLSVSITACQRLVRSLEDCVPNRPLSGGKSRIIRRMLLQRRLNQNKDTIQGVQNQIQIHTGIINTAFNLLIL